MNDQVTPPRNSASPKQGEVEKLSKENFNLKLRIFYLEDRLSKLRKGGETDESLQQELLEQKILLEEKQQELDERNLLLVKARNAIEGLHTDLALCRAELEECRNSQVSPEMLEEKQIEVDSLKYKIRELESKDKTRMEDILLLNNQIRDLSDQSQHDKAEVWAQRSHREKLEKEILSLQSQVQLARSHAEEKEDELESLAKQHASLKKELEIAQQKLVENARSLGDQRSREADLLSRIQESGRKDEEKVLELNEKVKALERERDQTMRACAMAERKAEDMEERLDEARVQNRKLEDKIHQLEMEVSQTKDLFTAKEDKMRLQTEMIRDELRRELGSRELDLRSQVSELKGKISALEFSRDEQKHQVEQERRRSQGLEAELRTAREDLDAKRKELQVFTQEAQQEIANLRSRVEDQETKRKQAELELESVLAKSSEREKEFRHQVKGWEDLILGKLDELVPHGAANQQHSSNNLSRSSISFADDRDAFSSDSQNDSVDENEENFGNVNISSASHHHHRPAPRRFGGESGSTFSPPHSKRKSKKASKLVDTQSVIMRLEDLRQIRAFFMESKYEMERKWHSKLKTLVLHLEKSESKLHHAQDRLAMFMESMQTIAKEKVHHLQGHNSDLSRRQETLFKQFQEEKREIERKYDRALEDREKLRDQLFSARERAALLDGEVRHVRAEVESLREEKRRMEAKFEKLFGSNSVLEENNRVLSLELEDRAKQIADLTTAQSKLVEQVQELNQTVQKKQAALSLLEGKLEKAFKSLKSRDKQLQDTKTKLDRSLYSEPHSPRRDTTKTEDTNGGASRLSPGQEGDFERNMWRQVEETERAIRSSSSTSGASSIGSGRKSRYPPMSSSGGLVVSQAQRASLEKSEAIFSEILIASAELVDRTQSLLRMQGSEMYDSTLHDLLRSNHRLSTELESLGRDLHALQKRILSSSSLHNEVSLKHTGGDAMYQQGWLSTFSTPDRSSKTSSRSRFGSFQLSGKKYQQQKDGLSSVHRHMLGRLGKIKADLEETATQLNFGKLESLGDYE